jgi:hypothetical protein
MVFFSRFVEQLCVLAGMRIFGGRNNAGYLQTLATNGSRLSIRMNRFSGNKPGLVTKIAAFTIL